MSSKDLLAQFDQSEAVAETHHNAIEALDEGIESIETRLFATCAETMLRLSIEISRVSP